MKADAWLVAATKKLQASNIASARLDALILLEDFTGKDRSWLLAHPDLLLKNPDELNSQLDRRVSHEPLAYIRRKSEFYGRTFTVSPSTLQPRPETETIIELFLDVIEKFSIKTVADIGTGSGCIAITAKLEKPSLTVLATEIDKQALAIAEQNAQNLTATITFSAGNLLEPIPKDAVIDALLTNLPYVPDSHTINEAARYEPKHAIFGGSDGLDLYRELFEQLMLRPQKPAIVITESLPPQHTLLTGIAELSGYDHIATQDFIQVFASNYS